MTTDDMAFEIIKRLDSIEDRLWKAPDSLSTRIALLEMEVKRTNKPAWLNAKTLYTAVFVVVSAIVAAVSGYQAGHPGAKTPSAQR